MLCMYYALRLTFISMMNTIMKILKISKVFEE